MENDSSMKFTSGASDVSIQGWRTRLEHPRQIPPSFRCDFFVGRSKLLNKDIRATLGWVIQSVFSCTRTQFFQNQESLGANVIYTNIYIYTHIWLFSFCCLGDLCFFQQKCRFSPHFWVIFPTTRNLSLRTLEGRDATVTFVHQGRISMKGTVNVARSWGKFPGGKQNNRIQ